MGVDGQGGQLLRSYGCVEANRSTPHLRLWLDGGYSQATPHGVEEWISPLRLARAARGIEDRP